MGYVIAAYLLTVALFIVYALTLTARQRLITDLTDAAGVEMRRS
jgi:hypothetical protein